MPLSIPLGLILGKISINYWLKPIDNSLRCMVLWYSMEDKDIQAKLVELKEKGWTLANIARALELSPVTIESWNTGIRSPANLQPVLASLDQLLKRRRIPKKKIYTKNNTKNG